METLMDTASGAYRVITLASTYVIDLDLEVVYREPRTGHADSALLPRDEPITLLEIIDCSVGRRMILRIDLHAVGLPFTARFAAQVVFSIDPEPSPAIETTR